MPQRASDCSIQSPIPWAARSCANDDAEAGSLPGFKQRHRPCDKPTQLAPLVQRLQRFLYRRPVTGSQFSLDLTGFSPQQLLSDI